jgi:Flp pilus assembly protein TadD
MENYDEAYSRFETALRIAPEDSSVNYHMAVVLMTMGKKDQARESLVKALEREGDFSGRREAEAMLKNIGT